MWVVSTHVPCEIETINYLCPIVSVYVSNLLDVSLMQNQTL